MDKVKVQFTPAGKTEKIDFKDDFIKPKTDKYFELEKLPSEEAIFKKALAEQVEADTKKAYKEDSGAFINHKNKYMIPQFINAVFTLLGFIVPLVGWAFVGVRLFKAQDPTLRVVETTREKETENLLTYVKGLSVHNN